MKRTAAGSADLSGAPLLSTFRRTDGKLMIVDSAPSPGTELLLPAAPTSVSQARQFVQRQLTRAACSQDDLESAVLLTSELVTNAVLHAGTDILLRVSVRDGIRIEVRDGSVDRPQRRRHRAESAAGRGLELVEALASSYGVEPRPPGKLVWFTIGNGVPAPRRGEWSSALGARHADAVAVRLLGVPVGLYEVLSEYHEALLRDYAVTLLGEPTPGNAVMRLLFNAEQARQLMTAAFATWRAHLPAGISLPTHGDLELLITEVQASAFRAFGELAVAAEELAAAGRLLTPRALPELIALREWLLGQVARQRRGATASAWQLPESNNDEPTSAGRPISDPALRWVATSLEAVVVADATNQIIAVSPAAAELLGYQAAELAGRRLSAIIPPELREAHLAGYNRQILTGRQSILDQTIKLPAQHCNGHHVELAVRITKQVTDSGQIRFLARLHNQQ